MRIYGPIYRQIRLMSLQVKIFTKHSVGSMYLQIIKNNIRYQNNRKKFSEPITVNS